MDPKTTRGFLNNNPGNMDRSTAYVWNGEVRDPAFAQNDCQRKELTTGRFCVFTDAEHGIRAMAKNLIAYRRAYGCETAYDYISHWAPPPKKKDPNAVAGTESNGEDQNDTKAYADAVAKHMGIRPSDFIDIGKPEILAALIEGMIRVECAGNPYENGEIERGVALA